MSSTGIRVDDRIKTTGRPDKLILATDGSFVSRSGKKTTIHSSGYVITDGHWGIYSYLTDKLLDPCQGKCAEASEMRAIWLGLDKIAPGTKATILTDSMNAIRHIDRWKAGDDRMPGWYSLRPRANSDVPTLVQLRDRIITDANFIDAQYVPGHSGDWLNEAADALAGIGKNVCKRIYDKTEAARRAGELVSSFLKSYAEA